MAQSNNYYGIALESGETLTVRDCVTYSSSTGDWYQYKVDIQDPAYWGWWAAASGQETFTNLPKGVEMKGYYDVYLFYGADRDKVIQHRKEGVIAVSDEDAKIKSGLMKLVDESWDADFITFIVRKIGDVKVKSKPQEVKNV